MLLCLDYTLGGQFNSWSLLQTPRITFEGPSNMSSDRREHEVCKLSNLKRRIAVEESSNLSQQCPYTVILKRSFVEMLGSV
jgi:hypothetical protein